RDRAREEPLHLVGPRARRDVVVLGLEPEEAVAHAAAVEERLVPRRLEPPRDREGRLARAELHAIFRHAAMVVILGLPTRRSRSWEPSSPSCSAPSWASASSARSGSSRRTTASSAGATR